MKKFFGTLKLVISKVMNMEFNDFTAKFDEMNIKCVRMVQVELMDGSLHTFNVDDHFVTWEDEKDVENK